MFHSLRSLCETEQGKGKQMPFIKTVCSMLDPSEKKRFPPCNGDTKEHTVKIEELIISAGGTSVLLHSCIHVFCSYLYMQPDLGT